MPYYTQIYSQISPDCSYPLDEVNSIILFPAERVDYSLAVGVLYLDSIYFYSNSEIESVHIDKLKRWIIFHSFIFGDSKPIQLFHNGLFKKHYEVENHEAVPISKNTNTNKRDFDNAEKVIYHPNEATVKIRYKELFQKTTNKQIDLMVGFFNPLSSNDIEYYDYTIFDLSYLKIVTFATLLEIIIGHSNNCDQEITCAKCGKKVSPHRVKSEKVWTKEYLKIAIANSEIEDEYLKHISFAFDIRHMAVHTGQIPSAKYILQNSNFEEYDYDKSEKQYKDNKTALSYLLINIERITRYLMLYNFYDLTLFYLLPTLKSKKFKDCYK